MDESYICACGKHGYIHASPRGYHFVSKEQGFRFLKERELRDPNLETMIASSSLPERLLGASPFTAVFVKELNLPHIHPEFYRCKTVVCILAQESNTVRAMSEEFREALLQSAQRGDDIPCWP